MTEQSFLLPDLGEGLTDAELLSWRVAVGDIVALNQVIAEVETAKAAVELPSPYAGRVLALHVAEGETVDVGAAIITFAVGAGGSADSEAAVGGGQAAVGEGQAAVGEGRAAAGVGGPEERIPVLVGYGATSGTGTRRNGRPRPAAALAPPPADNPLAATLAPPSTSAPADGTLPATLATPSAGDPVVARPLAKPLVRKLAKDLGIDLTTVAGTGLGGVITRTDVVNHASTEPPAPTPVPGRPDPPSTLSQPPSISQPPSGLAQPLATTPTAANPPASTTATAAREDRIPIRGVRKATAAAMVRSAFTAPQATEFITLDVTPTMDLLHRLRASSFTDGVRLTMTAFVATAIIQALRQHPALNSSWDEAAQEIVVKHYVNLGIATATPRGLLVPNLKDADQLGLFELAKALESLTATAREGHCTRADLTGGTISLTNVGMFGVDTGTPILNPGEAAILCLGVVRQQPWVHEGALAVRWVTTLSLSFDHRLVDGEQASRFLSAIAQTLTKA